MVVTVAVESAAVVMVIFALIGEQVVLKESIDGLLR